MDGNENQVDAAATVDQTSEDVLARLKLLELENKSLISEKRTMEADFGLKRAKLKDLYIQKEEELKHESTENISLKEKNSKLEEDLKKLKEELEDARNRAAIAECMKENDVEIERRKKNEEIATLKHFMKENVTAAVKKTSSHYEGELKRLKALNVKLEEELSEFHDVSLDRETAASPGVLSVVKTLTKRVGGLSPGSGQPLTSSTENLESENLEDSMKKAQEETEVMKSLVVPLEEEIKALKDKIRAMDNQLRIYEATQADVIKGSEAVAELLKGHSAPEVISMLDDKLNEVNKDLQAEKASRADLEMYVAILNTQKTVLQDDLERVRSQLQEVCILLEKEKRSHTELKNTWQMANDQFLQTQRLQIRDMRRIQSVLSEEQLRHVAELATQESIEEPSEKSADDSKSAASVTSPSNDLQVDGETSGLHAVVMTPDVEEKLAVTSLTLDDSTILNEQDEGGDASSQWSPENVPSLTEEQHKALSDLTPELESCRALVESARSSPGTMTPTLPPGCRMVSSIEWERLQAELKKAREKIGRPCDMCKNYETQLQQVQDTLKLARHEKEILEQAIGRYKEDLQREGTFRRDMVDKWDSTAMDYEKQLHGVENRASELQKELHILSKKYSEFQQDVCKEMYKLTNKREETQRELIRLQNENDELVGKHSAHAEQLQNETINLPDSMEEMQLLLLKLREDLIAAKVAKEHISSSLTSEIQLLKDQMKADQYAKNNLEDTYTQEIDSLREQVGILESIRSQLEVEQKQRYELQENVQQLQNQLQHRSTKDRQIIDALKRQVEEHTVQKSKLETSIIELRGQVSTLQQELDTSEAVQRDFVKLSQSLQVQLEQIRQAESEVRWQHEEDVDDCSACRGAFTVTRRKHHCRHCGKIFCSDCTSKTVTSGPNSRVSRVCDVCHTLLNRDTAPYFSTEPPHTPD